MPTYPINKSTDAIIRKQMEYFMAEQILCNQRGIDYCNDQTFWLQ